MSQQTYSGNKNISCDRQNNNLNLIQSVTPNVSSDTRVHPPLPVTYSISKSTQTFEKDGEHVVYMPCQSAATQTSFPPSQDTEPLASSKEPVEYILSVSSTNKNLPHLPLYFKDNCGVFLFDTGSSISLMDETFFNSIKSDITYKSLSRQVTISTVNSIVAFKSCIEISFKIDKAHFKQAFFIIDISSSSSQFHGIIGCDFMSKHQVVIHMAMRTVSINEVSIPFFDPSSSLEVNNNIKSSETQSSPSKSVVKLSRPITIQPGECNYALVRVPKKDLSSNILFEPKIKSPKMISYKSLVEVNQVDEKSCNSNQNQQFSFHIVVHNISDTECHLNKDTVVGSVSAVDTVIDNCTNEYDSLNLITASPEVKALRDSEFSIQDFKLGHLERQDRIVLEEILTNRSHSFSKTLKSMGHTDSVIPKLTFTSEYPIKTLPFPIPAALSQTAKLQLDQMVEAGIMSRKISEWASPMLLVKKKPDNSGEQKYRLAIDLRLINSILLHNTYPLPKIQTIIANIANYKFFSTLDMQQAYMQVNLPQQFRDRLAITTPFGTYCLNRLPFGLKTAAAIFQSLMDSILESVPGCYAYQDDIIICSNSFPETCDKLQNVLDIFIKHNLTLSAAKCTFHQTNIDFLGFNINNHKISPIHTNIIKIKSFPVPKTKRQTKRFVGLCGYYRHLIPEYAKLIQPLTKLSSPSSSFVWSEECNSSFENLQHIFFNQPFVRQPAWDKPFLLNTDASKKGIAAVLLQEFDKQLLPISYFSKALSPAETRYPAIKLELMAITKGVEAFRYFLYGRHFTVLSDSKPLSHYKKTTSPADITTRWLLQLGEYSFTFKHIAGKENLLPDYFSRLHEPPTVEDITSNPNLLCSDEPLPVVNLNALRKEPNVCHDQVDPIHEDGRNEVQLKTIYDAQRTDDELQAIFKKILQNNSSIPNFFIDSQTNLLMFLRKHELGREHSKPLIVIPKSLQAKVLNIAHFSHFGIVKTYEFLTSKYYWQGMYADAQNFVSSCKTCIKNKPHKIPQAPFQPTMIADRPGYLVSLDLVGPFSNGQHILTIIDHFSRHLQLFPLLSITSSAVIHALFSYIATHGRPSVILTDLGTQFTSEVFHKFNLSLGIKLNHTSTGRPQANAISERINTSIKSTISCLLETGYSFHDAVLTHQNIYNGSPHRATGLSPNLVHFGRELALITDTFQTGVEINNLAGAYNVVEKLKVLQNIYAQVAETSSSFKSNYYTKQHRNTSIRDFKVGDCVYIKSKNKFKPSYDGPFSVIELRSPVLVSVTRTPLLPQTGFTIHIDRLVKSQKRREHLDEEPLSAPPHQISQPYNLRPRNRK